MSSTSPLTRLPFIIDILRQIFVLPISFVSWVKKAFEINTIFYTHVHEKKNTLFIANNIIIALNTVKNIQSLGLILKNTRVYALCINIFFKIN